MNFSSVGVSLGTYKVMKGDNFYGLIILSSAKYFAKQLIDFIANLHADRIKYVILYIL